MLQWGGSSSEIIAPCGVGNIFGRSESLSNRRVCIAKKFITKFFLKEMTEIFRHLFPSLPPESQLDYVITEGVEESNKIR